MQFNEDIFNELKKILQWFLPSSLGVATKLAYDSRIKKIDRKHVISTLIMACFVGYITDKLCTKFGYTDVRGIAVAISALASEAAVGWALKNTGNGLTAIVYRVFNINVQKPVPDAEPDSASNTTTDGDINSNTENGS